MRILHLSWEYPPLVYGGLGRHVAALSRAQAKAGHEVTVVTQGPAGHTVEEGVRVVRVDTAPFPYHLPDLLTWVGGLDHRLAVAATGVPADVVHAHDWVTGRAGARISGMMAAPFVATLHATEAGRHSGWLPDAVAAGVHLVEQWLADEADELIVCSAAMAAEVRTAHGRVRRMTVIPNGIDITDPRERSTTPASLRDGAPRLSFVGRLEWEKGVLVAVAAMPSVLQQHPGARLRIVGTGGQAQAVADLVSSLSLSTHVELLGHVDEQTLQAVYATSDLLVAPSSYEPFGIVALEAAAARVPLVVGDAGGLAEFVTDERGIRVPANDPDALADGILTALADPKTTALRVERATAALSDYTWSRIAQRTDEVYAHARRHARPARQTRVGDRQIW